MSPTLRVAVFLAVAQVLFIGHFVAADNNDNDRPWWGDHDHDHDGPDDRPPSTAAPFSSTAAPPPPVTSTSTSPPTTTPYIPVGSLPLTADQQLSCQCRGFFTARRFVCATNNVTYNSTCLLAKAMRASAMMNKPLGLRCHHSCPCNDTQMLRTAEASGTCNVNNVQRAALQRHYRLRIRCNPVKYFCMTDGRQLKRSEIYCAMAKTPGLGVRCYGKCEECNSYNCYPRMGAAIPMFDDCPADYF